MFQILPSGFGKALDRVRPGFKGLAFHRPEFADVPDTIEVSSPAFADGQMIPVRHTADGEGVSPPLAWRNLPNHTRMVALLLEDADIPAPRPLVHALATDLLPVDGDLETGELPTTLSRTRPGMGRNSYFLRTYLPMDSLPGHGPHHYAFQLFALDEAMTFPVPPGRTALLRAMHGHVLAKGMLIGVYQRD